MAPWQWLTVAILSAFAGAMVTAVVLSPAPAAAQSGVAQAERPGLFAIAGQFSHDNYGIILVDSANSKMAIYEWVADRQGRKLRLAAARNCLYDLQLDDYNNAEPLPRDIQALVKQHRTLESGAASRP